MLKNIHGKVADKCGRCEGQCVMSVLNVWYCDGLDWETADVKS